MDIVNYTATDREQVNTMLAAPLVFPQEFKNWLTDYLSMNIPPLPVQQFMGFVKTRAYSNVITTDETVTNASYVDLATEGPILTDVPNGTYVLLYGATVRETGGTSQPYCGVAVPTVNDVPISDAFAIIGHPPSSDFNVTCSRAVVVTLDAGNPNNQISMVYKRTQGDGVIHFLYRWIAALRFS